MSAIFISYTGRDPEGDIWADRLAEWCREWNYGFFRDRDHSHGIKAGADWRASLYRQLGLAQALISLCTKQYDSSPWCVGEVAIAIEKGKTVIPIHLASTREDLKKQPLPLLLQDRQAIRVDPASTPTAEQLAEVKSQLQRTLNEKLNWRALTLWDGSLPPYPGLPAFDASQAPVFFGRDGAIDSVCEQLASLALRPKAFLLLLGASGTGKSSLVRAGVVPKLRGDRERHWLVLEPFKPGLDPFAALRGVLRAPLAAADLLQTEQQSGGEEAAGLTRQLHSLSSGRQAPVLVVIDQFEELLGDQRRPGQERTEGERFLEFLEGLLQLPTAGVMVLATMRTDFLDPLQTHWPGLLGLATTEPLQPIRPEDFGQLITGPATRSGLTVQPGLTERLVAESGGRDALPLLAFTLEKLWRKRQERGGSASGPNGERWDLTVADFDALGGVAGAVSHQAALCWNPSTSSAGDALALRQAFLDHLLTINDEGMAAKRPARLGDLPPRSRPIIQRLVDDRLLVSDAGVVEIAHEVLLRTWEPLEEWIQDGREELMQGLKVRRLLTFLTTEAPAKSRRKTLTDLAEMAAAGGSESRAVGKEASTALAIILANSLSTVPDRLDAALVLALIEAEEPLLQCIADTAAPVTVRRRAAECLGLLAKDSSNRDQRDRIALELEKRLYSDALDTWIQAGSADPDTTNSLGRFVDAWISICEQKGTLKGMTKQDISRARNDFLAQLFRDKPSRFADSSKANGWKSHDELLPLLQGSARGLEMARSPEIPFLGAELGLDLPRLTLNVLTEGPGIRIRSELVSPFVWQIPLPGGNGLELVKIPGGVYQVGSPREESGRCADVNQYDAYSGVDDEALCKIEIEDFFIARFPITIKQWESVLELPKVNREIARRTVSRSSPDPWERHAEKDAWPMVSISWHDCVEWGNRLSLWLSDHFSCVEGIKSAPHVFLPSEAQWEVACRGGVSSAFCFGDTIDADWANFHGDFVYWPGRNGEFRGRSLPVGSFGLVNRWGLSDVHGQIWEWCDDLWQRAPARSIPSGNLEEEFPELLGLHSGPQRTWRVLRGGSWYSGAEACRAASRIGFSPVATSESNGFRPVVIF